MNTFASKAGWIVAALAAVTLVASWAGAINAGPLDPPGDPASTMKSLDEIPGTWSRVLSTNASDPCNNSRFQCVMGNAAVLDQETGLVWQRQPDGDTRDWSSAIAICRELVIENRYGWRLPNLAELRSLQDASSSSGLPPNHPFVIGLNDTFWTTTEDVASAGRAMRVDIDGLTIMDDLRDQPHASWCVRGAGGDEVQ